MLRRQDIQGLCLAGILLVATFARANLRVAFIDSFPKEPWAERVVLAMHAAAEDLQIQLDVYKAPHWPTSISDQLREVLAGQTRPDYVVVSIHRGVGTELLKIAEAAQVPVFVINAGLLAEDHSRFGGPRESLLQWIGQMLPDDEQAGFELANRLVERAKSRRRKGEEIHLVALAGTPVDYATIEREKGLRRAVAHQENVVLHQIVSADWDYDQAFRKTTLLLRRYPQTQVIWSANDSMAMGALDAIANSGKRPGVDVLLGGMNWEPRALNAIEEGSLMVSMDGHFLQGAWALVLLHDLAHGRDFAEERVDWRTGLVAAVPSTTNGLWRMLNDATLWRKVDFRRFSKVHRPNLGRYTFTLDAFLLELGRAEARVRR
jgi:ABC-type sugar transport system substrate-binding protein